MRVLTWNLFHGRSDPPAGRSLLNEFAATLDAWEWDVALLQEVPPWWPPLLGRACGASARTALTSRNWLLGLRREISARNPDVLKAWGGGANAIQQYLRAGLVDEFTLAISPVLFDGGARLFAGMGRDIGLELVETVASPRTTHVRYAGRKP